MSFAPESKATPSAVNRLVHGDPAVAAHRDRGQPAAHAGPSGSTSFRQRTEGISYGSDDDFGRFAHAGPSSAAGEGGAIRVGSFAGGGGGFPPQSLSTLEAFTTPSYPAYDDGSAIQSLLASTSLTDSVHGDYLSETTATQTTPWRLAHDTTLPLDPAASPDLKGKGKATPTHSTPGDVSPTSASLLTSLSHLALSDQAYLRSLLAHSPERAVSDYFARGSYADDVWGVDGGPPRLPSAVEEVLSKAREGGGEGAGAREKAVRRLAMVARHLGGEGGFAGESGSRGGVRGVAEEAADVLNRTNGASESAGMDWTDEYPLVAQHSPGRTRSRALVDATTQNQYHTSSQDSRTAARMQQDLSHAQQARAASAQTHQLHPLAVQPAAQDNASAHAAVATSTASHWEGFQLPPAAAQESGGVRDAAKDDEQVGSPPLPPFRHYFEQKLRAMAVSQQQWMRKRRL